MTLLAKGVANGSAGPLGLLIVLLIGLALVLLIRNMNKRLKRLPASFDEGPDVSPPDGPSGESASGPSAGA
ncbi:MAG: hypothetical protein JWO12_9 [Frankiales bacterium]|nr:hypothetical protein [Frankiales bacterium]